MKLIRCKSTAEPEMALLFISSVDTIENPEIYKRYMQFSRISYTGKKPQVLKTSYFSSESSNITNLAQLDVVIIYTPSEVYGQLRTKCFKSYISTINALAM